jgi:hypothetical protein
VYFFLYYILKIIKAVDSKKKKNYLYMIYLYVNFFKLYYFIFVNFS